MSTSEQIVAVVGAIAAAIATIVTAKTNYIKVKGEGAKVDAEHLQGLIDTQKLQLSDFKELVEVLEGVIDKYKQEVETLENDIKELEKQLESQNITIENYKVREMQLLEKIDEISKYMQDEIQRQVAVHVEKHLEKLSERISKLESR